MVKKITLKWNLKLEQEWISNRMTSKKLYGIFSLAVAHGKKLVVPVCVHNTHSNCNLFKHSIERQREKSTCSKYSTPKWNSPKLCLRTYWRGEFMKINPISVLNHTNTKTHADIILANEKKAQTNSRGCLPFYTIVCVLRIKHSNIYCELILLYFSCSPF